MAEAVEINVKSLKAPELEPVEAYARLRSYTPGRPSFLLESRAADRPEGRYSIVGYRVRSGEMMAPGVDAVDVQSKELEQAELPESFAHALAQARVGFFTYGNAHTIHRIRHWEDEELSGSFITGATVVVFDHQQGEVTIAGPRQGNLVERCAWELEHAPSIAPAPQPTPALEPQTVRTELSDDKLAARATRAAAFLAEPLEEVVLAQSFKVPTGSSDPFEVYRALRQLCPAPLSYFIDFGQSPVAPSMQLLGCEKQSAFVQRRDGGEPCTAEALRDGLRAAFPPPSLSGKPPLDAARMVRRLEESRRDFLGAAVGYLCPGAEAAFAWAEEPIAARDGWFNVPVGVSVRADTQAAELAQTCRQLAGPRLAAIRAALDAAS